MAAGRTISGVAWVLLTCTMAASTTAGRSGDSLPASPAEAGERPRQRSIAHRGASAYAPEHTLAAYRLAIEQGADYVEQDLAVTRDGVLICLHDASLERTTNVAEMFPERARRHGLFRRRTWLAVDFTLEEIRQLDAGQWFDARFAGERIPTWEEAVAFVGERAGLYPELKNPELYRRHGIDMVALFVESLHRLGLAGAPDERLVVQSFDADALRRVAAALPLVARTFLIGRRDGLHWLTGRRLERIAGFATGIGPHKALIDRRPALVRAAQAAGLTVTPYTFTSQRRSRFSDVEAEMRYYLHELGVDALFTDNPDVFPRRGSRPSGRPD